MTSSICQVCGAASSVSLTEIDEDGATEHFFCIQHAPPDIQKDMPFGPHRTAAEEVVFLRQQLAVIDQQISDSEQRVQFKAELEALIGDIEAGRKRLGDAD